MVTGIQPSSPARISQVLMLLWLVVVPFSTGGAEILLGLACAATLCARLNATPESGWQGGWSCLVQGGPTTRAVPWLILAFLALYLLSVVTAVDPDTSLGKVHKLFRYTLFFILLAVPWDERIWHWAFRALVPVTVALAWLAVAALADGRSRAETPNLHYNTLSQVAAMISLLLLATTIYGPRRHRVERGWLALMAGVAAGILVITLSRAALVGWISGGVLIFVFRLPRRLVVAFLVVMIAVPVVTVPLLKQQRADLMDIEDPEFTRRYDMWAMARAIITDHPWTGIGPGGMGAVYDDYKTGSLVDDPQVWAHVHNDLLQVALTHGIPASLVWLALMLSLYLAMIRRLPRFRRLSGSWTKAGFAGVGVSLHLFYMCGFVHDNYNIYIKICMLLFLWGQFVSLDRHLEETGRAADAERVAGVVS